MVIANSISHFEVLHILLLHHILDGVVIEGLVNAVDAAGFKIQITCTGTEKNLSGCTYHGKPLNSDCTIAAVSCKINTSEGIPVFQ